MVSAAAELRAQAPALEVASDPATLPCDFCNDSPARHGSQLASPGIFVLQHQHAARGLALPAPSAPSCTLEPRPQPRSQGSSSSLLPLTAAHALLLTSWQGAGGPHRGVISLHHHEQPATARGASSSPQSHNEDPQLNIEDTDTALGLTLSRIRMVWASHDAHTARIPPPSLSPCGRFLQPQQRRAWEVLAQPQLSQRCCRRPARIYKPVTYVLQSLANRRPDAALPQLKVGKPLPEE